MDDNISVDNSSNTIENDSSSAKNQPQHLNILSPNSTKINEKFVIKFTKESTRSKDRDAKRACKVASFSSDWTIEELQSFLNGLHADDLPNLFIFVINLNNAGFYKSSQSSESTRTRNKFVKTVEKVKKCLIKFSEARPLVLQLTSEDENVTKIYYKEQASSKFIGIDQQDRSFKKSSNFQTFLCSFLATSENIENYAADNLLQLKNSSLILRFLRIFQLSEDFFKKLVLTSAAFGSKNDILAAIDAQFDGNGGILSTDSQKYLIKLIIEQKNSSHSDVGVNHIQIEDKQVIDDNLSTSKNQQSSNNSNTSCVITNSHMNPSVLHSAVHNSNKPVIDYLITHCTHLIQQLPFKHQVRVSTEAFETQQLDVLCDLLEISDFPFPDNYQIDSVEDERFLKIVDKRMKLQLAIETESMKTISQFIDKHLSLRFVYGPTNKSALKIAADSKKFKVYYYLKSYGYQATEFNDIEDILGEISLKEARNVKEQQRRKNARNALGDELSPVNLLCTRSFIHDRRIKIEQETVYRSKIRKWYEDISKVQFGWDLLDIAASCENLKIIFDFESHSVENVSLDDPDVLGTIFPSQKWIFVGSKLSDHKRDQQIKGVLAHELCHYVMKLLYENNENPYYKHKAATIKSFEAIVTAIDKWSTDDSQDPDDECNGIISSVFKLYDKKDFYPELIVRVMQILAEFDDDKETTKYLKGKYKDLFDFFRIHVLADWETFDLKCRENLRKFNRLMELLSNISGQEVEFSSSKDTKQLFEDHSMTVLTNIPKLLLINIHKCLKVEYGDLLDTKNIFLDSNKLKNLEILREYQKLMTKYPETRVYVDFSRSSVDDLNEIVVCQKSSYIFVVSSPSQQKELFQKLEDIKSISIDFEWNDLTAESQDKLLKQNVNFQHNLQFSLYDLLDKGSEYKDDEPSFCDHVILQKFSEIVDDQLLSALLDKHQISINSTFENEKYFEFLYQQRNLRREQKDPEHEHVPKLEHMSQDEFLVDIEDQTFILISDIAGNGKSWAMKNFTKIIRKQNPTSWVTYVDLKQFIKEFKAQTGVSVFSTFMAEKVLSIKFNFESLIFQRLYKDGKVFILFDGFDEIAPDCAECVSNLATSFESNGGNQLWIATRDYFEVNLKEKLRLESVYKLSNFDHKENVEQIVRLWLLNDFKKQNSETSLKVFFQNSPKKAQYLELANKVYEKISMKKYTWWKVLGGPQINKMIADISKNDKTAVLDLRQLQIFESFIKSLYKQWAYDKGQLRKMANIESQNMELNFRKFHQYAAVKHYFSEYVEKFYPDYDGSEWTEEEIIACGLMTKQFGFLSFTHATFGEYFIADLILKHLKSCAEDWTVTFFIKNVFSKGPNECVVSMFVHVLVNEYGFYEVIRMLINEGIENVAILDGIKPKMPFFMSKFYKIDKFSHFFTKNLDKLADFVIETLKDGVYEKVKNILFESVEAVVKDTESLEMFTKFQTFLFETLKFEDLKGLIIKEELLEKMIRFNPNVEIIEDFTSKVETKFGSDFVKDRLKSVTSNGTVFHILSELPEKTLQVLKIIQKYLKDSEIIELTKIVDKKQENVLHLCAQNGNINLWLEIENIYASQELTKQFKELVFQKGNYGRNIHSSLAICNVTKFHNYFWKLFLRYFSKSKDLMEFVLERNKFDNNFIHYIAEFKAASIRILTFKILKHKLTSEHYKHVISTRNNEKRNILQLAANNRSLNVESHRVTWKIVRESCETDDEFLEILNEPDWDGVRILCNAVHSQSPDIIVFMIQEMETFCSREELTKILCDTDCLRRNLLLLAAISIKSLDTHIFLWNMFEKYVEPTKLFEFIQPCVGEYKNNILMCAAYGNKIEVVQFIWKKVKALITQKEDQIEYLNVKNSYGEDIQRWSRRNFSNPRVNKWVRNLLSQYGLLK